MARYEVKKALHAGALGVWRKGDVVDLTDAQADHFATTAPGVLAPAFQTGGQVSSSKPVATLAGEQVRPPKATTKKEPS